MAESLRVLIVDEDPDSRVTARKAVQRGSFGIAGESGFGTQAVSLALQSTPDLILVSVEEPVERPLETAESLANALPDTPILVYSSLSDSDAVRRAMVFGARDYLRKPLQATAVRDAIYRALDQEERRQMRRAGQLAGEAGKGTVIVVTGAKGGIGKTVVSVNLAMALRLETGKSVALVDADTQFGDVATLLDVTPAMTAADVIRHPERFDRAGASAFMYQHPTGVDLLPTSREEDPWLECPPEVWKHIVDTLSASYEFVVVDTSGAFDSFVRRALESSSMIFMVTTGEVSSVRDSAAAMTRLANWGIDPSRVRIIFNRGARATGVSKEDLARAVGREVFWELPNDKAVPQSVQFGRPVVLDPKNDGLGRSLRELARLIAGTRRSLVTQPSSPSLLSRFTPFRGRNTNDAAIPEPDPQR